MFRFFMIYYKYTIIKRMQYCGRNEYIDKWEKKQSPEIDSSTIGQMILKKAFDEGKIYFFFQNNFATTRYLYEGKK